MAGDSQTAAILCAVEDDGEAALERRDVLDGKQAQPGAAGGDDCVNGDVSGAYPVVQFRTQR